MIIIYTDGSSRGNPGPGGWGSIIITDDTVTELGGREAMTTNNRMELTAAVEALRQVPSGSQVTLYTDSQYVTKGMSEWIHGWQAKGWKTVQKKPVLNRELWEELLNVSKNKEILWKFVRGHADTAGNVRCDEIATRLADGENMALYKGAREKYTYPEILNFA
jgi:ribonuclease HI